jgi:6-phosphogluconate dehydrogenase
VSDGIGGLKVGYCLMIGGEKAVYEKLLSIFETLAPAESYLYGGASAL